MLDIRVLLEGWAVTVGGVPNLIGIIVLLVLLAVGSFAITRFGLHEQVAKLVKAWAIVDDAILDLVVFLSYNDSVDLAAADVESKRLAEEDKYIIDPRMLYIVQEIQRLAKDRLGVTLDFVLVHRRAERIFQNVKAADNGLNV